jgi:ADP-sugar diphosphatase
MRVAQARRLPAFGDAARARFRPEGRPLPAYALIKGHACLVVTVVVNGDTGERKFLMLRQRRIAHGRESLEFPAGMLDDEVDDPAGTAVREMREETGLEIRREDLVPLSPVPLFTSPGLDDEALYYFACTVTLPAGRFHALEGGAGGNAEEGEFIRLGLWEYPDALREVTSAQVRLGFYLYFDSIGALGTKLGK